MKIRLARPDSGADPLAALLRNRLQNKDLRSVVRSDHRVTIILTTHLGHDTMEGLREAIESKPHDPSKKTIVVIARHETGLHDLDTYKQAKDRALAELEKTIADLDQKPAFVSYIHEDLHVDNIRQMVTEP